MNKEQAREALKENFDEISRKEYNLLNSFGELRIFCSDETLYFKPKQKFPIVFEDERYKIEVYEFGDIDIIDKISEKGIYFSDLIKLLEKAIEKSKELRKKNE